MFEHLTAVRLDSGGEKVAAVMAQGETGEDHGDLLAELVAHKGRHCLNLVCYIGDVGLERIMVEHARGDRMGFGDHETGDLELTRAEGADPMTTWLNNVPRAVFWPCWVVSFWTTFAPRLASAPSSSATISTGRPLNPPAWFIIATAA